MSAKDYPPIRGPGARQIAYALLLGEVVPKDKWNSWTYSEEFKDCYGVPIVYWSHWEKLISTPCRTKLCPELHGTTYEILRDINFFNFAQGVDKKAVQFGYSVPGRLEMESLYAQFLLRKFDETKETDVEKKCTLKDALEKRLNDKAERYWVEKKDKFGMDVDARLDEEANEPPGESNIEFDDGDSIENEYGSKQEGDMEDNGDETDVVVDEMLVEATTPMKAYQL